MARDRLLDAAETCLQGKGLSGTTMEDIARHAGVSRATVYRYFASRESVVSGVIVRAAERYLHRTSGRILAHTDLGSAILDFVAVTVRAARSVFNLPTLLTWARIVAIPLIVGVFYLPLDAATRNLIATVMFVVFALTDWLDGWLARKLNQTSAFGAFLDPVADKFLVCASLLVLVKLDRVDVLIADDGLQHYRLGRDVEVVVVDEATLGNRLRLPAGPLRESVTRIAQSSVALAHGRLSHRLREALADVPVFEFTLAGDVFERVGDRSERCVQGDQRASSTC